jgi:hypothetical protein
MNPQRTMTVRKIININDKLIEKQPVSIRQKIVKSNKCSLTGKIA